MIEDDAILQNFMLSVKLLEQTELLVTLSSVTFTIKDKSQGKKYFVLNLYYCNS